MKTGRLAAIICLVAALTFDAAAAVMRGTSRNSVKLSAAEQGEDWLVRLDFLPAAGWHIYSHTPGDFGQPTEVSWQLNGSELLEEEWAAGEDVLYRGFGLNVYKNGGFYRARLRKHPQALPRLKVSWTACADECVPEAAEFALTPEAFADSVPQTSNSTVPQSPLPPKEAGLWYIMLLAFAGGIILNFMPCVFPILFIKVMAFASAGEGNKNAREAWSYMAGVVTCFLLIAALLWGLKAAGYAIGWGFQLQSEYFVLTMAALFFVLGLMFLDLLQINFAYSRLPAGAFATGLLAVLIASPCTAPFMGVALGWVLTTARSPWVYYPVFLVLGVGYALPFFAAGIYPQLLRRILPKPGKWMLILKKIFAIPMFVTAMWLLWVWHGESSRSELWQPFDAQKVTAEAAAGHKILLNFTAKWCITCLVNEKNVFADAEFARMAQKHNIRLFKADWSNHNPQITAALSQYGRSSIPLYVFYDGSGSYRFLPQLLGLETLRRLLEDDAAAQN